MPETFPVINSMTGRMEDQPCLTVAEMALRMHTTKDAVYRKVSRGDWPYFKAVRRVYFTPEHVRQIVAMSTHHVDGLPVLPDDDNGGGMGTVHRLGGGH